MAGEIDSFIFGGNTGLTYEQLKRRRAVALALASQRRGYPKTVGEGLTYLGESMGDLISERRLDAAEKEAAARASALAPSLMPGAGAGTAPVSAPARPGAAPTPIIPPAAPRPPSVPVRPPPAAIPPRAAPAAAPIPVFPEGLSSQAMTSGPPPSEFAMGGILNAAPMAAPNLEPRFPGEEGIPASLAGIVPSSGYLPPTATAAAPPSNAPIPPAAAPPVNAMDTAEWPAGPVNAPPTGELQPTEVPRRMLETGVPGPQSSAAPAAFSGDAPPNVLAQAQQVALSGGPAAVSAFMKDAGYPKSGAWCGQFAAAVSSSAGVQPPAGPAVASNWRNVGTPVDTPQIGDVAIARPGWSRRGSGETGQVGSHVTFVNQADAVGSFQGLGGNQSGGPISSFNARDFEFRRLPGDIQGQRIFGVPGEEPPGTQVAAYAPGGRVSDAPVPGMGGGGNIRLRSDPFAPPAGAAPAAPADSEQITPTNIEPMPATAQFGPPVGRFSRSDAPMPGVEPQAQAPQVLAAPAAPVATASPPQPQGPPPAAARPVETVPDEYTKQLQEPDPPKYPDKLSPDEEKGWKITLAHPDPNDPLHQAGQRLADFGKAQREAGYKRDVEAWTKQIELIRTENAKRYEYFRNQPKTMSELESKQREAAIAGRFGSVKTYETLVGDLGKSYDKASSAANVLPNLYDAKEMAKNAITGFGANARLDYNRALNAFGITATGDKVRDTQALQAAIAPLVGAILKSTTGTTQVSEGDRKFAQAAAGGDITLDAPAIQRILDIGERSFKANIADHNKHLGSVFTDPQGQDRALHARYKVDMPLSSADKAAQEWLAQNPNDPRAAAVRRKLGVQ